MTEAEQGKNKRMRRTGVVVIVLGTVFTIGIGVGVGIGVSTRATGRAPYVEVTATRYHCPMHPTYTSDKPGDCPICGMKLVPIEETGEAEPTAAPSSGDREVAFYRSPMDPSIHADEPAKDEMGMDFVPVYKDEIQGGSSGVAGRAVVTISSERQQVLGVRSEEVRKIHLTQRIRTVGRVAVDERRLHHVHTKFEGYVEKLYADYTGQLVRRGERLLSIYSPDLVATQQEYLLAQRGRAQLADGSVQSAAQGSTDLLEAARQRLLLWDIRPRDIESLAETGRVTRTLDLHSDITGYVVQKTVYQGMRVTPGDTLYDIADLSRLWVLADVYEYNLPSIALGMGGLIRVASIPGREWKSRVAYISPTVEEKTRTVKVRLDVDNAGGELKPEMYADVFLQVNLGEGLVVQDSAVINTGDRRLVFLDRGDGRFEPREVRLGTRTDGGSLQVLSGLAEGDRVVTAANFLLDSESSLKAALSGMSSTGESPSQSPAPPHEH